MIHIYIELSNILTVTHLQCTCVFTQGTAKNTVIFIILRKTVVQMYNRIAGPRMVQGLNL